MPIERLGPGWQRKGSFRIPIKGLATMPIERLVMKPIKRPCVHANRRAWPQCQSKHYLVDIPVKRQFVRSNKKQPYLRCPPKLPCWKCPSNVPTPIEGPFADARRRTFCRCQSKNLLQMSIEGPFADAN